MNLQSQISLSLPQPFKAQKIQENRPIVLSGVSTPLDSLGEEEKEGDLMVTLNNSKEDLRIVHNGKGKEKGFIGWSNQEVEGAKKTISELLQQATEFVDQHNNNDISSKDGDQGWEYESFSQEDEEQQRHNKEAGMPAMTVEQQVEGLNSSNDRTGNGNGSFNKSQPVWR
ncbi:hypothetical protein PPACK8108_LOCUS2574 [Phakopsora pachyrhizi]|uniref:Uncharacterized protein n=1 Tax=Phakopsora pachyrhizi TaxID=170000 RepID=A0AAV0AIP2_PHAPC|nr:hypothetical protein PPACK8108_LOCUS2574 [Phakopsora pachyrhizi]